jgi:hypothetical protein
MNWLIDDDKEVICLDTDKTNLVPVQTDLVNLMELGKYFSWQQKKEVINAYVTEFNRHSDEKITDAADFELGYLAATVNRAIALTSAWSSPARSMMWGRRSVMIDNGIEALEIIRMEHNDFYRQNSWQLDSLDSGLRQLKEKFT